MAQCYRNSGSLKNGMAAQAHRTSGSFAPRLFKFRNKACEIPESQSKTTLTAQKQEVVQITFEQLAVSEHPQSCLPKDAKADAAIP